MYEFADDGVDVTSRKYYSLVSEMVAMREWVNQGEATIYYFANDHLSSTSIVMDASGGLLSENRYLPFGEKRTISGTTGITETDFTYTGQRDYSGDFGLMDYTRHVSIAHPWGGSRSQIVWYHGQITLNLGTDFLLVITIQFFIMIPVAILQLNLLRI